ncbi:MAG: hypothetical protein FJX54_22795 [Alphaproteobacteria bacterium]|nr:hypothetical protein [Alphaproteobacteria bacterium]
MKYQVSSFDLEDRRRQKQASRDADAARLQRGEISRDELKEANSFFRAIEPAKLKISAIGGRPLNRSR